jgi:fumarate hydratase, class II
MKDSEFQTPSAQIGWECMPDELIRALAIQKKAAAQANLQLGLLDGHIANAIEDAADDVITGRLDEHFSLSVWQDGSGAGTDANMVDVLARISGAPAESVNLNQSAADSFASAMHIALLSLGTGHLEPAQGRLRIALSAKAESFSAITTAGRAHLRDAEPLTLGQSFATFAHQVTQNEQRLDKAYNQLYELACNSNAHEGFDIAFCEAVSNFTSLAFKPCPDMLYAVAAHDALVNLSGKLNTISMTSNKIAADIRLLSSGPGAGLGELVLPEDGLDHLEALCQVAAQVMGNHTTVTIAATQGQLQLNAFKPVLAYSLLQSTKLLGDAINGFTDHCLSGLCADEARIGQLFAASTEIGEN